MSRRVEAVGTLVRPAVSLCVLLVSLPLCGATSDPVSDTCNPLCEDFVQVDQECAALRGCSQYAQDDIGTFLACVDPCWELSAPCFQLCADSFDTLWDTCEAQCEQSIEMDCEVLCFDTSFTALKQSNLTLPDPNIGPFVPIEDDEDDDDDSDSGEDEASK